MLSEVSNALNLEFSKYTQTVSGSVEGIKVTIRKSTENGKKCYIIYVEHSLKVKGSINISKESTFFRENDILTGDGDFDKEISISATYPYNIFAILNKKNREQILKLAYCTKHFKISDSWSSALILKSSIKNSEKLISCIKIMVSISKNLTTNNNIKNRLIDNIISDPIPDVRLKNIQSLLSHFPVDDEILLGLRKAINDKSLKIQIEASRHLKDEGMKHLVEMLKSNKDINDDSIIEIVKILNENKYKKSESILKDIFIKSNNNNKLLIEILNAFTAFSDKKLNSFLLDQLEKNNHDIQSNIIEALGTCGQVDAVERLYKIAKSSINPSIRNAVQKSIAQIQSRLGEADKGWLSISELSEKDGALSIANEAREGSLSISGKKDK